jgi:plastocyanin
LETLDTFGGRSSPLGAVLKRQAAQHVNLLKGVANVAHSRSVWCGWLVSVAALVGCGGSATVPAARPEALGDPAPEVSTVRGSFTLDTPAPTPVVVMLEPLARGTLPPTRRRVIRVTSLTDLFNPQFVVADTGDTLVFVNGGNLKHEFFSPEIGMDVSYPLGAGSEFWSLNFLGAGVRTFFCRLHYDETFSVYVSDTPFHAVPNEHGQYVIAEVPEGAYRLTLWSKAAEGVIRNVQVSERGLTVENIRINLRGSGT